MPSTAETRRMIRKAVRKLGERFPEKATIAFIDGNLADIRVDNSPSLLRHCPIVGDPTTVVVGQTVSIKWEASPGGTKSPVVLAAGVGDGGTASEIRMPAAVVDDVTIENSEIGIRVKHGGLDLAHLSFTPAMSGHTHADSFTSSGWIITEDGVIVSPGLGTYIYPDGMIVLGTQPNVVKLSGSNADYRIWAGDNDPAAAPFSVSKAGAIKATSGEIANWNIGSYSLSADNGLANIVSGPTYPWIGLGTMTEFGETGTIGIWMGLDTDDIYKLYIGNPVGDHMYWDGDVLYITGVYEGVLNVEETWADTFTINSNLDAVTSKLILGRAGGNAEFAWDGTEIGINRKINVVGSITGSDDLTINTDGLIVDASENKVYINAGTLPTYRGALTVKPNVASDKAVVIQSVAAQSANMIEILNSSDAVVWRAMPNGDLESGNFTRGLTGWTIEGTGDAEFNNIVARGEIRASVFTIGEMQASAGTLGVFYSASKLYADCTTPASTEQSFTLDADDSDDDVYLFNVNDVIRIKSWSGSALKDAWGLITARTAHTGYSTYTVTLKSGSVNTTFRKGTAIADYGPSGKGFILMSADGTAGSSPNISMAKHAGSPWSTITPLVRIGNLNGTLGISGDEYGIAWGKDMALTTEPYAIFSDTQARLVGIAQEWWNSTGAAVAGIDPTAVGSEPLFWLGPSVNDKRLQYTATGILALKNGTYIGNANSRSVLLRDGRLWAPLDGGPWSNSFWIDLRNQINFAAPEASTSVFGFRSIFNKGAALGGASTNYVENPKFTANITDDWGAAVGNGTVARDTSLYHVSPASCKITAGTNDTYIQTDGAGVSVPNNSTVYAQCRLYRSGSGSNVRLQIINTTSGGTVQATANSSVETTFELVVAKWTNTTGGAKTVQVRISNAANDSTTIGYYDCVQLELDRPTPWFFGTINSVASGYSWSGTADQSTSVRATAGYIKYPCAWSASQWTVSCMITPTMMPDEATTGARIWEWYKDGDNRVVLYYNSTTDLLELYWRGNGTVTSISGSETINRGEANHFAATWDGTTLKLYVNGVLDNEATGVTAMASSPDYMYIGNDTSLGSTTCLNGIVDDFIVLVAAQPAETIAQLAAAIYPTVVVGNSEIHMYESGYGRTRLSPYGLFMANSLGEAVLGVSSGPLAASWGGFNLAEGDIVFGHNKANKSAIFWDQSAGTFGFYGNAGGTAQVEIATDGTLKAGGGAVIMASTGLRIISSSIGNEEEKQLRFRNGDDSANLAAIVPYEAGGTNNTLTISTQQAGGMDTDIIIDPAGIVRVDSDLYTVAWTDYSATSTVVGWASYTSKIIKYKKVGKLVFVQFYITGTSNNTATSFTLPYSPNTTADVVIRIKDNSGSWTTGLCEHPASASACNFYINLSGNAWTSSGTKAIIGEYFFEATT